MAALLRRLQVLSKGAGVGFFQIGGGIAGDFPICVVPSIKYDLAAAGEALGLLLPDLRLDHVVRLVLGRDAQREDHLGQAHRDTPMFVIESDATIVAPLMLQALLECKAQPRRGQRPHRPATWAESM
jgi:deoxyhypusine synthase